MPPRLKSEGGGVLCVSVGDVGNSAANSGALIEVADGADPVIPVRDNERKSARQVATDEENGSERLAFLNSL